MPITRAYAQAAEPGNFFVAGKNKIINGDFNVNQRVFTSTTSDAAYTFDRWRTSREGGTVTYSSEAFTLGSAPVSGYESKNYARIVTASQSAASHYAQFIQRIENVRTFAGQTVTLSFWAKASSGTPSIAAESHQSFGSGGSPSSAVFTTFGKTAITTSWARYSLTLAIPSISGKTLGTADDSFLGINFWTSAGSDYNARSSSLGLQNVTIDLWGVQVEAGSVATPFTTATGTLAGELAACQRYYQKSFEMGTAPTNGNNPNGQVYYNRQASSGSIEPTVWVKLAPSMRTAPSVTLYNPYLASPTGQWSDGSISSANARTINIGDSGFAIDNNDVSYATTNYAIHYAASSEL